MTGVLIGVTHGICGLTEHVGLADQQSDGMFAQVGAYMEHNHVALQLDITTAGGSHLNDLASLYGLDAQGTQVMLERVRQNRRVLMALLHADRFKRSTVVRFTNIVLGTLY